MRGSLEYVCRPESISSIIADTPFVIFECFYNLMGFSLSRGSLDLLLCGVGFAVFDIVMG